MFRAIGRIICVQQAPKIKEASQNLPVKPSKASWLEITAREISNSTKKIEAAFNKKGDPNGIGLNHTKAESLHTCACGFAKAQKTLPQWWYSGLSWNHPETFALGP